MPDPEATPTEHVNGTALAVVDAPPPAPAHTALVTRTYLDERRDLIREQLAPGASDAELELLIETSIARGLNPILRQIYGVMRWDSSKGRKVMGIQTGIDGFRLVAQRTGDYRGQAPTEWCGPDGVWRDVWLENTPPSAARVGVLRAGWSVPLYAVARWSSYVQTNRDGSPAPMWAKMGDVMLAKVAEALALRKAFPEDLSGLYTDDEMAQASHSDPGPVPEPRPATPPVDEALVAERVLAVYATGEYDGEPEDDASARVKLIGTAVVEAGITKRAMLQDDEVYHRALELAREAVADAEGDPDPEAAEGEDGPAEAAQEPPAATPEPEATPEATPEPEPPAEPVSFAHLDPPAEGSDEAELGARRLAPLRVRLDGDDVALVNLAEGLGMNALEVVYDDACHAAFTAAVKAEQDRRAKAGA